MARARPDCSEFRDVRGVRDAAGPGGVAAHVPGAMIKQTSVVSCVTLILGEDGRSVTVTHTQQAADGGIYQATRLTPPGKLIIRSRRLLQEPDREGGPRPSCRQDDRGLPRARNVCLSPHPFPFEREQRLG